MAPRLGSYDIASLLLTVTLCAGVLGINALPDIVFAKAGRSLMPELDFPFVLLAIGSSLASARILSRRTLDANANRWGTAYALLSLSSAVMGAGWGVMAISHFWYFVGLDMGVRVGMALLGPFMGATWGVGLGFLAAPFLLSLAYLNVLALQKVGRSPSA